MDIPFFCKCSIPLVTRLYTPITIISDPYKALIAASPQLLPNDLGIFCVPYLDKPESQFQLSEVSQLRGNEAMLRCSAVAIFSASFESIVTLKKFSTSVVPYQFSKSRLSTPFLYLLRSCWPRKICLHAMHAQYTAFGSRLGGNTASFDSWSLCLRDFSPVHLFSWLILMTVTKQRQMLNTLVKIQKDNLLIIERLWAEYGMRYNESKIINVTQFLRINL